MTEPVAIDEQIAGVKAVINADSALAKNFWCAVIESLERLQSEESALTAERERAEKAEAALARVEKRRDAAIQEIMHLSKELAKLDPTRKPMVLNTLAADKGCKHE